MAGKLFIVATPIGNLEDMTFRAIRILQEVDLICCEDTRNTLKLLNHFDIKNKLVAYHKNNRNEKVANIIDVLKDNKNVAIVTDAGTPLISDPGYELVHACYEEGIEVNTVPGACACISALTLSGLPNDSFVFQGFLPETKKEMENILDDLKFETRTMIFYIAPHKFQKNIDALINIFSENREASLSREMTKIHEETFHSTLIDIKNKFYITGIKGEIVLCVKGLDKKQKENLVLMGYENISIKAQFDELVKNGMNEKDAMKKIAKDRKIDKREVYKEIKI